MTSSGIDRCVIAGAVTLIVALGALAGLPATALADEDDEDVEYRPGLVAEYKTDDGTTVVRRDEAIAFDWHTKPPDPRLPAGRFSVAWKGLLQSGPTGMYEVHAFARGQVRVQVDGQTILDASSDEPGWHASKPIRLTFGRHPLDVQYRALGAQARLALFWSGPQFGLEPLTVTQLKHLPADSPPDDFERGEVLARALRCAACHHMAGQRDVLPAPALVHVAGNLSPAWLPAWLTAKPPAAGERTATATGSESIVRRMPHLALTASEAEAIGAYLFEASAKQSAEKPAAVAEKPAKAGDPQAGAKLFRSVGCLACHRVESLGSRGLFDGGDLSAIARKRPAEFFRRWLADPAAINPQHRMPVFPLTPEEVNDLSAYLASLTAAVVGETPAPPRDADSALVAAGRKLIVEHRCHACHTLPGDVLPAVAKKPIGRSSTWDRACTASPHAATHRPGYQLEQSQQAALRAYVTATRPGDAASQPALDGRFVLLERNCISCHSRALWPGLADRLAAVGQADRRLTPLLAALTPPSLASVGDKLHDEALLAAITQPTNKHRPWLMVRMPRFPLSEAESAALVAHFVSGDRIPDVPPAPVKAAEAALDLAGSRLATADGFGCTSCHQIGSNQPHNVALNAHGPDLSLVGKRIRRPWFERWVRNPARIVARMEMPAVQIAVRGVLDERLDDQIAALWTVLNRPGFEPPLANPVRVVRATNMPGASDRAKVLTDVLEIGKGTNLIKPLLVGLPNRHNVLLDFEHNRFAGWWIGDTARQRTRGKSWYWEPGGSPLVTPTADGPTELVLRRGDKTLEPLVEGQFPTEFDFVEHTPGGIRWGQRLKFAARDAGQPPTVLHVKQSISVAPPEKKSSETGFARTIEVAGLAADEVLVFHPLPCEPQTGSIDSNTIRLQTAGDESRVRVTQPKGVKLELVDKIASVVLPASRDGKAVSLELEYRTSLPVDRYTTSVTPPTPLRAVSVDVVPGFEGKQLPLDDQIMPTGLAWRPDGTLVICSLQGQVWLAHDTDGDGLEEQCIVLSDELAAPYGVIAHGDAIDVINKYALLRLIDGGTGHVQRTETLASGWSHTDDYHDWAVGIVRDQRDNYYVALPCQQDNRSPVAARWRGAGLRLTPQTPTDADPHRFRVEPFCAGLRFPMGLAMNRAGALFATDNQGNYKPFNELNHLVDGARYGFINKLEQQADFHPARQPAAVNIPHPWTRSVNGICFLETPYEVRARMNQEFFGPLEGHLVGCEYDTRRLVRMSLQHVGGEFQGAVYPMSAPPAEGAETFEGPLVCGVGPNAALYVGSIRDSGWGAGHNTGSIVRLRHTGQWSAGIAEMTVEADGFRVQFTQPIENDAVADPASYDLASYRRIATSAYGAKDSDRRAERIDRVSVSADRRSVVLMVRQLRAGFVYELHVKELATKFFPAEAHYTLQRIPE